MEYKDIEQIPNGYRISLPNGGKVEIWRSNGGAECAACEAIAFLLTEIPITYDEGFADGYRDGFNQGSDYR